MQAQSATYPLQLHAVILPPYTNCLGDYVSQGNSRLKLTAIVRDMTRYGKDLKVSVAMKVKMGNTVLLETRTPYPQVLSNVGVQTPIETADLFDPKNSNARGKYANNGWCLPEGAYEFEFQIFDYYNTKLPLSEPVSMFCYLNQGEPPIGISPISISDDDCLPTSNPNIMFTWSDAVAAGLSQKTYTLSVYEAKDYTYVAKMFGKQDMSAYEVVYEAKNLVTNSHVVMPTTSFPIAGKTYMWRVTINPEYDNYTGASGSKYSAYKNNGHSQWYAFTYGCKEPEPAKVDLSVKPEILSFEAVEGDKSAGIVTWKNDAQFCGYILKYQNKEDKNEAWASIDVTNDLKDNEDGTYSYTLKNLAAGETFLATVTGKLDCGENEKISGESEQKELELEAIVIASEKKEEDCKINVDQVQNSDIKELKVGECFYANGNWVRIDEISYTNGSFTGKGVYSFSFLKNVVGVNVEFKDVKINESRELIQGDVKAISDKTDNMMLDINSFMNKSNTGSGEAQQQSNISTIELTEDELKAELEKESSEYEGKLLQTGSKVYTIEKVDGKLQQVSLGDVVDQEKFCPPMFSGLDNEKGYVKFSAKENWNPPFDYECFPFCNNIQVNDSYKKEDGYGVPWIAMAEDHHIVIKAELMEGLSVDDDFGFYCHTKEKTIKLESKETSKKGVYDVTIFAGDAGKALYIFAMKQTNKNSAGEDADCSGTKTLGRAQIFTCKKKSYKVKLVPVFENITVDASKLKEELNKVYQPLGQTFEVEFENEVFNDESIQQYSAEKAFELDETNAFRNESQAMKDLRRAYKNAKGDAVKGYDAFVFLLPKKVASNQNVGGEMPRSSSVGYVFASGNSYTDHRTLAHEIGHGLFSLEHTFSIFKDVPQGSTDNLMDYNNGNNLKYWQWALVNDPKGYVMPFMDDAEDAQAFKEDGTSIKCIANTSLEELKKIAKYRYFYLPDGQIIDLQKTEGHDILPCSFYAKDDVTETARGAIQAVYYEGNVYDVVFNKNTKQVLGFAYNIKKSETDENDYTVYIFKVDDRKVNINDIKNTEYPPVRVFVNKDSACVYKYVEDVKADKLNFYTANTYFERVEKFNVISSSGNCGEIYIIPNHDNHDNCIINETALDYLKELNEFSKKNSLSNDEKSKLVDVILKSTNSLIIPFNKDLRLVQLLKHLTLSTNESILQGRERAILKILHNIDSKHIKDVPKYLNEPDYSILDNLLDRFQGDNYKELIQLLGKIYGADYAQLEKAYIHTISKDKVWDSSELFALQLLINIKEKDYLKFLRRLQDSGKGYSEINLLEGDGDFKYLDLSIKNIDNYGVKWINNNDNYLQFFAILLNMYNYVFEKYLKDYADEVGINLRVNYYGQDGNGTYERGDYDFNSHLVIVSSYKHVHIDGATYELEDGTEYDTSYDGPQLFETNKYVPFAPVAIYMSTDIDLINAAVQNFPDKTNILVPAIFLKYYTDTKNAHYAKNAAIVTGAIAAVGVTVYFAGPAAIKFAATSLTKRAVQEASIRAVKGAVFEGLSYLIADYLTASIIKGEDYQFSTTFKKVDFYSDVASASIEAALNINNKWAQMGVDCLESMDIDKFYTIYEGKEDPRKLIVELAQECIVAIAFDGFSLWLIDSKNKEIFKRCPISKLDKLFDYFKCDSKELFVKIFDKNKSDYIKQSIDIFDDLLAKNPKLFGKKPITPKHYDDLAEVLEHLPEGYTDKMKKIMVENLNGVPTLFKTMSQKIKDSEKALINFLDSKYNDLCMTKRPKTTINDNKIDECFSKTENIYEIFASYDGTDIKVYVWDGVEFLKGEALKMVVNKLDQVIDNWFNSNEK